MICVDANIVIRLVVGGEHAGLIAERWPICAITDEEARTALDAVIDLRIATNAEPSVHRRALAIAQRLGLTAAYDAHYRNRIRGCYTATTTPRSSWHFKKEATL